MDGRGSQIIGGYISPSILAANIKPQVPNTKEKNDLDKDCVDLAGARGDDKIFQFKKFNPELDKSREFGMDMIHNSSGTIQAGSLAGDIAIDTCVDTGIDKNLNPYWAGVGPESPCSEAAILTAQTIVEKDLAETGKKKYADLKSCPSTGVVTQLEGYNKDFADIVVKNEPVMIEVE